jgi:hypothetical protein
MMLSAVFGLVHAVLLHALDPASIGTATGWDLLIGVVHGVIIIVVLPMMLTMTHPLVRRGEIERPGVLMVGFGSMTPLGSLTAHAVYGLVTGLIYAAALL